MQRKILAVACLSLLAAVLSVVLVGSAANVNVTAVACKDFDAATRSAASDALSNQALSSSSLTAALFSLSGLVPCGNSEGRRTGLAAEVDYMLNKGDPLIGKNAGSTANAQLYANLASVPPGDERYLNIERAYARALAVQVQIRAGYQLVPGGAAEAFNRIQTCLNGNLKSTQRAGGKPAVGGVALDCSSEAMRRSVSDSIAPGFYIQFGSLPVVNFDCNDMLAQAGSGSTVEARWAAAQAYVAKCGVDVSDLAAMGGSAELRAAAVGPLATQIANGTARVASKTTTTEQRLAIAWAAGLLLEQGVTANAIDCNPEDAKGNSLLKGARATSNTEQTATYIAPLARYYHSGYTFTGNRCALTRSANVLTLTIAQYVPGATLPLFSYISTIPAGQ